MGDRAGVLVVAHQLLPIVVEEATDQDLEENEIEEEKANVSACAVWKDCWLGYEPLQARGYIHQVTFLRGQQKSPSELLPRVHRVVSLLKRWLLGTHQGAIGHYHLDDYLNEFTFRFNRRTSVSRGKLFYRLASKLCR